MQANGRRPAATRDFSLCSLGGVLLGGQVGQALKRRVEVWDRYRMLVSHRKKFIFLKTIKTGGTSVELALEPFCRAPDAPSPQHHSPEFVSPEGIVGARGHGVSGRPKYYNHMPASEVRGNVGQEIWDQYLKLTVVRNPYDKVVSWFWMHLHSSMRAKCSEDFKLTRRVFQDWLKVMPNLPKDSNIYTIDREIICDKIIRYEALNEQVEDLFVNLELGGVNLPRLKARSRRRSEPHEEYYDVVSEEIVRNAYAFEIKNFGYSL